MFKTQLWLWNWTNSLKAAEAADTHLNTTQTVQLFWALDFNKHEGEKWLIFQHFWSLMKPQSTVWPQNA